MSTFPLAEPPDNSLANSQHVRLLLSRTSYTDHERITDGESVLTIPNSASW